MWLLILAIASIVIWSGVSQEIVKFPKEKNKEKIITLMSAGTLSTVILTVLLFQNIRF
jgi:hypothetical protein